MHTLLLSVFKDAHGYDCTNGGLSSKTSNLEMIYETDIPNVKKDEISQDNLVVYVDRHMFGEHCPVLVPFNLYDDYKASRKPIMFGGNFGYTSDSRMPTHRPVPIHDRVETWSEYESFSH